MKPEKPSDRFDSWEQPEIEHGVLTEYNWLVLNPDHLELADYVDIAAFVLINSVSGVKIEKDVQIGPFTTIMSGSTIDGVEKPVTIKEGALIGAHSTIMPGVTIGKDAVVGAHSFVNQDVPKGTLVTGVPASVKRASGETK